MLAVAEGRVGVGVGAETRTRTRTRTATPFRVIAKNPTPQEVST